MLMTRGLVALLLTIALAAPCVALPAAAFGQSAGDDQYVDPFQGSDEPQNNSGGQDNSGLAGDQTGTSQPDTSAPAVAPSQTGTADATASDSGSLPRTGMPLAGLAIGGLVMLGSGLAIRRRA
jgi:hypothetical protein